MRSIPWWLWIIIIIILIGVFPGLYHSIASHLHNGINTVCSTCQVGG